MEFQFDVNTLLPDKISKINHKLQINGRIPKKNEKDQRVQLLKIIDQMGAASARAQGLHIPVTTGEKLLHSEHTIYIIKESQQDNDIDVVVGILKMGRKKLFLINESGAQIETFPLCVLDFYVHESKQRVGYGKQLYEFMLKEENILPHLLAIDRPSSKFLAFLRKHYNLSKTIPQVNHFIIFEGFFKDRRVTHRKSIEYQPNYETDILGCSILKCENQASPLLATHNKNSNRSSCPYYTDSSSFAIKDENVQCTRDYTCAKKNEKKSGGIPNSKTSPMLNWQGVSLATPERLSLGSSTDPRPTLKLTPDSSCASHVAEDSTMKIFGVPSAWMQASGR